MSSPLPSPLQQWQLLEESRVAVTVSEELLQKAKTAFDRQEVVFLHHVVAVAFPQLPTLKAARKAIRQGRVLVDGELNAKHDALAPPIGSVLLASMGLVDSILQGVEGLLQSWNSKSQRPEARIYLVEEDPHAGWAVVNKPPGMHCKPCAFNTNLVTLEGYLPALVQPPLTGTHCRCPRVCHRLDFRVAGPVLVATAEETMRSLKASFEQRSVTKETHLVDILSGILRSVDRWEKQALTSRSQRPSLMKRPRPRLRCCELFPARITAICRS